MSRSTKDLIEELQADALALKFEGEKTISVVLVVGFESSSECVSHDDPDALKKLNDLVRRGGHPAGMITLIKGKDANGKGTLVIKTKPLDEHADDEQIAQFLARLADTVGGNLRREMGL